MAFLDLPPYSLEMVQETWTGNGGRTQEFSLIHSGSSPSFRGAGDDTWLCSGICTELPMQASVQTLSVCRKHTQPFSCESQKNLHAQYLSPHSLRPVLFSPPPTHFPFSPSHFSLVSLPSSRATPISVLCPRQRSGWRWATGQEHWKEKLVYLCSRGKGGITLLFISYKQKLIKEGINYSNIPA